MVSLRSVNASLACFLNGLFFLSLPAQAGDWSQWRGSDRDGVFHAGGLIDSIPENGLKVLWRSRVGQSYSGPAVAEGKVFVTGRLKDPDREQVLCLDEIDGKQLWEHNYPCEYADMEYGNGPRTTPTVHEGKVYTLGTKGHLFCFDSVSGEVLWKKDLKSEYGAREPRYGISAAPIVEKDLLIVCVGGEPDAFVVAFDRNTGEERWRSLPDRPAYCAPEIIDHGGTRQLIVWSAENVSSLNPENGNVYWQVPFEVSFDDAQIVASPVLRKDHLLCLAGWGRGSLMLKLNPETPGASIAWRTKRDPTTTFSTPWFPGEDYFYATLMGGKLACLDARNGDEIWSTHEPTGERAGSAHITPVERGDGSSGGAFLFNQKGQLILADLTPEGYSERGRCLLVEATAGDRAQGPVTWAHPAYANRKIYARNDREIICASLAASDYEDAPVILTEGPEAEILKGLRGRSACAGLRFSPDGKLLAAVTWGGEVKILNRADNSVLPGPKKHRWAAVSVDFSPDGKWLLSGGGTEFQSSGDEKRQLAEFVLWDLATGTEKARLQGHENKIYVVRFSPDGKRFVTGSADRTIRLWDTVSVKELAVLKGHKDAVSSLAFSPDEKFLVSAGWDGEIRIWDAANGQEKGLLAQQDEEILSLAVSPDGKRIATGSSDWKIRVWDWEDRSEALVIEGHRGAIYSVAFSPDGTVLGSGSGDQTIKLWRLENGEEISTFRGHQSGITSIAFSPDGKNLASAGHDDSARIWKLK